MQWSIANGMVEYVNTKDIEALTPVVSILSKEYEIQKNWATMDGENNKFRYLVLNQLQGNDLPPSQIDKRGDHRKPNRPRHMPPPRHLKDNQPANPNIDFSRRMLPPPKHEVHYVLFDKDGAYVVGNYAEELQYSRTPIVVNDLVVGYFAVSKRNRLTQGYELDFLEKQQDYLWIIGVVLMLFVVLITFPLARHVVEPIKLIADGMHKLTQGEYQQKINLHRKDELGELIRDYNELAITLAENETARKRWLANISHELRTPVAILSLELEAMLDEIRPMTKENIASASDELKHLENLIDDLHQLTIADIGGMRYTKTKQDITQLLDNEKNKYQSYLGDTGICLEVNLLAQPIDIYCDKTRLLQLFENIINNSIKYSEATTVKLSTRIIKDKNTSFVYITVEDDGVGVDAKHLPSLFEYLYRTDESRNRKTGGAGLGLSICRHIVIAHQGEISAQQSSLGGLAILIKLPLA